MGCLKLTYSQENEPTFLKVWKNDYGFRFYDAALARFPSVDPLSESNNVQSPYVYAANNPINFIDILGLDDHDPDGEENNLVSVNVNGELFSLSLSDFITWFNNNFSNNEGNNQEDSDEDQNSENEEDEEDEKDEKDDSYIWWKWGIAFTSDEGNGQSTGFMAFNTYYVDYDFISIFALWLARAKGTENTKKVDSEKGKEVIEGQSDGPTPAKKYSRPDSIPIIATPEHTVDSAKLLDKKTGKIYYKSITEGDTIGWNYYN
jgi:RHS repeat-associated protein